MANPDDFAHTVKQQADIVRIVGEYVKLRKAGAQNFVGLCPFHQEKTASFSVHATQQFYHCFGCKASGDIFSFVQRIENITVPEAVRAVAEKLGIAAPRARYSSPEEERQARQRGALLDIQEAACTWFQQQLGRPEAARAREYLASRGVSQEMIGEFRIGFAPESGFLLRDFLQRGFAEGILRDSGLFSWKDKESLSMVSGPLSEKAGPAAPITEAESSAGIAEAPRPRTIENRKPPTEYRPLTALYSKFRNRVMFPIANEAGKVIAFTGRTLSADEKSGPKYLNSPETAIYSKSRVLFNLDKAKKAIRELDYAILVEGQMDCIAVYMAGFRNVIASSGTAFTDQQARQIGRFSRNIVVNFDPDTAGAAAAERSLALLVSEDFQIKVLTLDAGFDPDLFIRSRGVSAYQDALAHSQKYFDYLIESARKQFATRTPQGKVKALNFLLPHIQRIPSRIVRDELANEISHRLAIDSTVLRQELRHAAASRAAGRVNLVHTSAVTDAERLLIRALADRDLGRSPASERGGQDMAFEPARQVHFVLSRERLHADTSAERLIDALLRAEEPGPDLMSVPLEEPDRELLASVLMNGHEELTPELLEGALNSLRKRHREHDLRELQQRVKELEPRQDIASRAQLAQERLRLKRALRSPGGVDIADKG